jgi:hypothetical protein
MCYLVAFQFVPSVLLSSVAFGKPHVRAAACKAIRERATMSFRTFFDAVSVLPFTHPLKEVQVHRTLFIYVKLSVIATAATFLTLKVYYSLSLHLR